MRLNLTVVAVALVALAIVLTICLVVLDLTHPNIDTEDTIGHIMIMWGAVAPGVIALLALKQTNGKVNKLNGDVAETVKALQASITDRKQLHRELAAARRRERALAKRLADQRDHKG